MHKRALVALLVAMCSAAPAAAQGGSRSLNAARELYASARYDEALALLDGLRPADTANASDRRAIEQYRSLCLLALGRGTEAEDAIAAVVTADPMYQPSETDASPRVRAAFSEVRQRLLPSIAMSHYTAAKRLYDRKQFPAAVEGFRYVLQLLDDRDMKRQHGDLRVLASGFLDLSVAAATPPPETAKKEVAPPPSVPVPATPGARIYSSDDPGITPPVVLKQELPRVPQSITSHVRDRGVVEVVIDELGRPTLVTIRNSVHPMYDNLVLTSARDWRYKPATLAGTPVKFRKLIQISLAKR